jgi:hypothetical protein
MMRAKRTVMNAWRTAAMTLVALSALSAANALNLVQDPSFETTQSNNNYGFNPTTWFLNQSFGSTPLGGSPTGEVWQVINGSIDLVRAPGFGGPPGPGNDQFVELNGNGPGAIRQTVTVGVGGLYDFSFHYGGYAAWIDNNGNQQNAAPDYVLSAVARIVDSSNNNVVHSAVVSWSIAAGGFNGSWINTPYMAQFVLPAGTYLIEFETLHFGGVDSNNNYIPDYFGPRIDSVNLSLVPEPASMVALGAGLAGLLGLRRRRAQG